jgi:hypothetical protein
MKRLTPNIVFAIMILAGALAFKYAQRIGLIGPDPDGRAVQVIIGLTLVFFANAIPKKLGRWRNAEAAKRAQSASRVAGWSFTLSGLAYSGLWAFAPLPVADTVSTAAVASAVVVTFVYTVWACTARTGGETAPISADNP